MVRGADKVVTSRAGTGRATMGARPIRSSEPGRCSEVNQPTPTDAPVDEQAGPGTGSAEPTLDLSERYGLGRSRRLRRVTPLVIGGAAIAAVLGVLIWGGLDSATPSAKGALVSFDVVSDEAIRIGIQVDGRPGGTARCDLRAASEDLHVVGTTTVSVTLDDDGRRVTNVTLPTSRRATNGELLDCTAD